MNVCKRSFFANVYIFEILAPKNSICGCQISVLRFLFQTRADTRRRALTETRRLRYLSAETDAYLKRFRNF